MAQLGLHSLAFTPFWNPTDADRLLPPIKELGATLIEVPLLDPRRFDSAGTRRAVERHEMQVVCSLGLPASMDVTNDTATVAAFLDHVVLAAHEAGSEALSGVTYGTIGKTSGAPPTERELDAICRLVERVAKTAKALGMRLGLEPCNRYETHLLNTAAQTARIIERTGVPNAFIHLDTYHMNIEERGMAEGFADAGEHLGYVHLSESNRGVPGRGTIDWQATFEGIREVGFDGAMTLESFVYVAPEIAAGLAVWRPVAERAGDVLDLGLPFLADEARKAGLDLTTG
ncbi:MAG: sugar phosphate isomerase/epimerase family protein [Rhodobacter sp.]|nr:sugar phosphate isomerase/epimerase family protein [Rhodobacter sp.]